MEPLEQVCQHPGVPNHPDWEKLGEAVCWVADCFSELAVVCVAFDGEGNIK